MVLAVVETENSSPDIAAIFARWGVDVSGADETWLYLNHPEMPPTPHGWKLHISTRPEQLGDTIGLVLPILRDHVCQAKFARSVEIVRELNSGIGGPAAVGKAVTVYPRQDDVAALAAELVAVLRDRPGPRVVSDRRVAPDAPVYYRYGPFQATYRTSRLGADELVMVGPDGETFPGDAGATYRCPPWATDPFTAPEPSGSATIGAGAYRITGGIRRSPCGNVYRAIAVATGRPVVIKQARAWAGEDADGLDARDRLRHEHDTLDALSGVDGVPAVVDRVRHGDDEYLVTTDVGRRNLLAEVRDRGPYPPGAWYGLAGRLLQVLDAIHSRGVVVRDLKPHNVVLDDQGRAWLVDFGTSRYGGRQPRGATPGYSLAGQWRNEPARPSDDYHGLGGILYYAVTGLEPVCVADDDQTNRDRGLACLAALPVEDRVAGILSRLLSLDPDERTAGARLLRSGAPVPPTTLAAPPEPTAAVLDAAVEYCVDSAERLLAADGARGARPLTTLYHGSSGIGLELAQHPDRAGIGDLLGRLAERAVTGVPLDDLPAGLYHGRTGIALFLTSAAPLTDVAATHAERLSRRPMDWWLAGLTSADQLHGLAGAGLGHLLIARRAPDDAVAGRHLAIATECRRRLLAGAYQTACAERRARSALGAADDFAHGRAGVVHFLLSHALATGEPPDPVTAADCADLAALTGNESTWPPGLGSWCGGLAGLGTTLVLAAAVHPDGPFLAAAERAARTCLTIAPRMAFVSQCCGLAGLGEFLIDLAGETGKDVYRRGAADVAGLILARSGGTADRPVFPDNSLSGPSAGWGVGTAGVLSFFRRLGAHGGVRPCLSC